MGLVVLGQVIRGHSVRGGVKGLVSYGAVRGQSVP